MDYSLRLCVLPQAPHRLLYYLDALEQLHRLTHRAFDADL